MKHGRVSLNVWEHGLWIFCLTVQHCLMTIRRYTMPHWFASIRQRAVENDVGRIVKYGRIWPAPLAVNACRVSPIQLCSVSVCLPHVQQCVTLINECSGHHADTLRFLNRIGCNT